MYNFAAFASSDPGYVVGPVTYTFAISPALANAPTVQIDSAARTITVLSNDNADASAYTITLTADDGVQTGTGTFQLTITSFPVALTPPAGLSAMSYSIGSVAVT